LHTPSPSTSTFSRHTSLKKQKTILHCFQAKVLESDSPQDCAPDDEIEAHTQLMICAPDDEIEAHTQPTICAPDDEIEAHTQAMICDPDDEIEAHTQAMICDPDDDE